jgi:hypothetical protein
VDAHHQQVLDASLAQKAVDFRAAIGNHIFIRDAKGGVLSRPRFIEFVACIAAAG